MLGAEEALNATSVDTSNNNLPLPRNNRKTLIFPLTTIHVILNSVYIINNKVIMQSPPHITAFEISQLRGGLP